MSDDTLKTQGVEELVPYFLAQLEGFVETRIRHYEEEMAMWSVLDEQYLQLQGLAFLDLLKLLAERSSQEVSINPDELTEEQYWSTIFPSDGLLMVVFPDNDPDNEKLRNTHMFKIMRLSEGRDRLEISLSDTDRFQVLYTNRIGHSQGGSDLRVRHCVENNEVLYVDCPRTFGYDRNGFEVNDWYRGEYPITVRFYPASTEDDLKDMEDALGRVLNPTELSIDDLQRMMKRPGT